MTFLFCLIMIFIDNSSMFKLEIDSSILKVIPSFKIQKHEMNSEYPYYSSDCQIHINDKDIADIEK